MGSASLARSRPPAARLRGAGARIARLRPARDRVHGRADGIARRLPALVVRDEPRCDRGGRRRVPDHAPPAATRERCSSSHSSSRTRRRRGSRVALRSGTVESLEERLRLMRRCRRRSERPGCGRDPAPPRRRPRRPRPNHTRPRREGPRILLQPRPTARARRRRPRSPQLGRPAARHREARGQSAEILNKPGRPTEDEWEQLRAHPALRRDPRRTAARVARRLGRCSRISPRALGRRRLPPRGLPEPRSRSPAESWRSPTCST